MFVSSHLGICVCIYNVLMYKLQRVNIQPILLYNIVISDYYRLINLSHLTIYQNVCTKVGAKKYQLLYFIKII